MRTPTQLGFRTAAQTALASLIVTVGVLILGDLAGADRISEVNFADTLDRAGVVALVSVISGLVSWGQNRSGH